MAIVFTGGTIRIDGHEADVDRLVVVDGAVAEAWHPLPDDAEHIDLEGGLLLPAFGDGHAHPLLAGRERTGPALRDAGSVDEIVERVRAWGARSDAPWLIGGSYDATVAPGGMFDARWLDAAVPDRPVVLHAWDYHTAWVNTAALREAGVDADTPDPELGRLVRRADGSPSGTLVERPAIDLVLNRAPRPSMRDDVEALAAATEVLAAHGIAWVQEAWTETHDVPAWIAAARSGRLRVDVDLALRADPARWPDHLDELVRVAAIVRGEPGSPAAR